MRGTVLIMTLLFTGNCAGTLDVTPVVDERPPAAALKPPSLATQNIPSQIITLENGLEVLAVQNTASPMVGLNLLIRVGSAFEDFSTSGMSHMLEHLLFNGTDRRTQEELYEETDFYGAYSNAHTDLFYTQFMLLLPAEFLEQGMDIQSDMIFNSVLPEEKFEKERGIVMEEIRKDRDRESYEISNYFKRMNLGPSGAGLPTLGTTSTIAHLPRAETYRFYRSHYIPNNMVLAIIGNFDFVRLRSLLEKYYGVYPPGPAGAYRSPVYRITSGGINQTSGKSSRVMGQIVFEAPSFGLPGQLSYELFTPILNEELTSSLKQYNVSAAYSAFPDQGLLVIDVSAEAGSDADLLFSQVSAELTRIDSNLEDIVTSDRTALRLKREKVENYSLLDTPHYYGIMKATDMALGGGAYTLGKVELLTAVTSEQIIRHVRGFTGADHQFNLLSPQRFEDDTSGHRQVASEKSLLRSGALLVTSTGGGSRMFGMHILIKNRYILEDDLEGGAEILHSMLVSGTDRYTKEDLQLELKSLGATLKTVDMDFIPYDDYYNVPDYGYIRFECLNDDAPQGIRLVTHILDKTTIDDDKVEDALKDARRRAGRQAGTALYTANLEFNRLLLGQDHPSARSVSGTAESLQRVTTAKLRDLQQDYFSPENYIISISSEIPHRQLVEIFNATWSGRAEPVERRVPELPIVLSRQERTIELGKEQAQIRLGYTFKLDPADKAAASLMTSLLSYRMMFDLRETRGLAYTLSLKSTIEGDKAWISASMGTGVANVQSAINGIRSYLDPAQLDDLTPRELKKTVNAGKGRYMMRNLTRLGQAYYLGYHEYYDGDYRRALTRSSEFDSLTVEDIQRVAHQYLSLPSAHTVVIVK